jgi:TetR/AcrR family transcriptional regulator, transcriptional repressor of bet genes
MLSGEALREAKVRQRFESVLAEIVRRVERVLEAGVESGAFGCSEVRAAASGLVATIQGYYVMAATARALIPRGTAAATTKAMVRGLTGAAP